MALKSSSIVDNVSKHGLIKVKAISAMCESCFHPVSFRLFKNFYDKNAADDHLCYIMLCCITQIKNQTKLLDFWLKLVFTLNRHTHKQRFNIFSRFFMLKYWKKCSPWYPWHFSSMLLIKNTRKEPSLVVSFNWFKINIKVDLVRLQKTPND